ncbi:kita-kyushu lung cancer antigen 1 [Sminthopsis crassicaudata]|uniref:kita-kyushu lung cancer antigen 1 n=1 Tax=Sminthopsis crassicaudata TaxID=9301 RepID=UPI003D6832A9
MAEQLVVEEEGAGLNTGRRQLQLTRARGARRGRPPVPGQSLRPNCTLPSFLSRPVLPVPLPLSPAPPASTPAPPPSLPSFPSTCGPRCPPLQLPSGGSEQEAARAPPPHLHLRTHGQTTTMFVGAMYLLLTGGIFAGLCILAWIKGWKWLKRRIPEARAENDEEDATSKDKMENGLSVRNLSKEILNDYPHSIAMQKRILLNLRMVEYKLAELEQFLVAQGLSGEMEYQQICEKDPDNSNVNGDQQ